MNQATIHTDPTAPYVPNRPRMARFGAVLLLAFLAALTVQSFFARTNPSTLSHIAPQVVRPAAAPLCREFPKAHFVFIDARAGVVPTPASTCSNQTMLSV